MNINSQMQIHCPKIGLDAFNNKILQVDVIGISGLDKDAVTEYIIQVKQYHLTWVVYRRYSEFRRLRDIAIKLMKDCSKELLIQLRKYEFPQRRLCTPKEGSILDERRNSLNLFLKQLLILLSQSDSILSKQGFLLKSRSQAMYQYMQGFLLLDFFPSLTRRPCIISKGAIIHPLDNNIYSLYNKNKTIKQPNFIKKKDIENKEVPNFLLDGDREYNVLAAALEYDNKLGEENSISEEDTTAHELLACGMTNKEVQLILRTLCRFVERAALNLPSPFRAGNGGALQVDRKKLNKEIRRAGLRHGYYESISWKNLDNGAIVDTFNSFAATQWQRLGKCR